MRVLAFDIGLRNLAAVVVATKSDFSFASFPQFKTYACAEETADEFKRRALQHFLAHGWTLEQWDLIDVSDALERTVKNVKRLNDVTKAIALADTLQKLEDRWFSESAPDVVCVETQHNANAIMRGVSMGTVVFFRRSFPDTHMEGKSGGHKLKICDALGVVEGDGLAVGVSKKAAKVEKAAAKAASKKSGKGKPKVARLEDDAEPAATVLTVKAEPEAETKPPGRRAAGFRGNFVSTGKKKEKYEDNKVRAVLAVNVLMPEGHDVLRAHAKKQDDLCDVLLMALWVLWSNVAPRAPVRRASKTK
jgi:hypothetical protein